MMKLPPRCRSLRRRQCAALCAKIRLHVTRLMESARFYCNRKLFCARRLRPSYRTSHMLTRPVREKERKKEREVIPSALGKIFIDSLLHTRQATSGCSLERFIRHFIIFINKVENLNEYKSLLERIQYISS